MKIEIVKGDITKMCVDVIVNAANSSLLGGSGVDGAIHRAGGSAILDECKKIRELHGPCNTGDVVITNAGKLNAKYIIHTVGPVWNNGKNNEEELLKSCYIKSLELAAQYKAESIAFPNISTGVYGYPKEKALMVVESVIKKVLRDSSFVHLQRIVFVTFDDENYDLYRAASFNSGADESL